MLQTVHQTLAPSPFLFGAYEQPEWVSVSRENAEKARFVISKEFLQSQAPFEDPGYLEIDYPWRAGRVRDIAGICSSEIFRQKIRQLSEGRLGFGMKKPFPVHPQAKSYPEEYKFLTDACNQFRAIDHFIYGQTNVEWHFEFDIKTLAKNYVHRRKDDVSDAEGYHIDGPLGDHPTVAQRFLSHLQAENHPQGHSGVWRFYSAANIFQTDFPGKKFEPWDIIHFIGERHRSPIILEECVRFFLLGVAVPLRTESRLSLN